MKRSSNSVSFGTKLTGTTATSVFTNSDKKARITAIMIATTSVEAETATIDWYDSSATTSYRILYQGEVLPFGYVHVEPPEMWLMQNDEIRVTASTANKLEVIVTVEQFAGHSG